MALVQRLVALGGQVAFAGGFEGDLRGIDGALQDLSV